MEEFVKKVKQEYNFALLWGELGPIYGKQWRDFNGVDQIKELIKNIKENPNSRRLMVSAWNVGELDQMVLPPCHYGFQCYVNDGKLSLMWNQRSVDTLLGLPFNIASYALLTEMLAQVCGFKTGEFIHTLGDAHIYNNHLEQIRLQLSRTPKPLPKLKLNQKIQNLFDFKYEDVEILNYDPHPAIKGIVSV